MLREEKEPFVILNQKDFDNCFGLLHVDYVLNLESEVFLPSHGYPNNYPSDAYVLWTFVRAYGEESTDIVYEISFGYVRIDYHDYLKIGYGWDPNNATALIISYGDGYYGNPSDIFVSATKIFAEFDATSSYEDSGFQLRLSLRNISGMLI